MGEVYRAYDSKLKRDVAIKILPEALARDPERVSRVEREAELLAPLNHSNIAVVHDFQQSGDRHFLVMELVEGDTLADRLTHGALAMTEALHLVHRWGDDPVAAVPEVLRMAVGQVGRRAP